MVSHLETEQGLVYAYIEWEIVNEKGKLDNDGKFIYIQTCWVHKHHRNNGAIKNLSRLIYNHDFSKTADYVYWNFGRRNYRISKLYDKHRFVKENRNGTKATRNTCRTESVGYSQS